MSQPITVLLCGAGNRGLDGYGAYALRHPDQIKIVAAADPLPWRRQQVQERHQVARVFNDWQEVVGHPRLAQVAIVATPDGNHVEPTLALLEMGYHVLLEKPMALNSEDCWRLVHKAEESERILTVCHVLRYAPYFREMKRFLDGNRLGQLITMRHFEPVNFWRFAHSFVRGNWSNEETSSPFILSKCCHDFDLLAYLIDRPCRKVASFGNLTHFRAENRPSGATRRCHDCPLECPYDARRYYGERLAQGKTGWPVNVVTQTFTQEALEAALETGPYGRCVYDCHNDVVDHQVVNLEFEGGLTASFTAAAFTDHRVRETEIMGSQGSLRGDGTHLEFFDFGRREVERWEVKAEGMHLGGDRAMLESFIRAVRTGDRSLLDTGPRESVASHLMAFAAEESRLRGQTVQMA